MAFSNAGRSLRVFLTGDTQGLEKALARAEYKMKRFNAGAGGAAARGMGGGGFIGMAGGKGGLFAAGAGAAALGLRSASNAARDAEVVLGQTSLAVENAGVSWQQNAARIDAAATRISKASSFDDEDVLQSFATFVRNQKDVGKSLDLTALAADVARGNFQDLAWGTTIVNKAAMGQVGALRRAGIQINKNATSTQALTLLQQKFGGAAVRYSESAAGAQDRLAVSSENLKEKIGNGLNPVLTEMVNALVLGIDATGGLIDKFKQLPGGGTAVPGFLKGLFLINTIDQFFGDNNKVGPTGPAGTPSKGGLQGITGLTGPAGPKPTLVTQMSTRLDAQLARAQRTAGTADDRAALGAMQTFLQSALKQKGLKPGQRTQLEQALTAVVNQIQGMYDDQVQVVSQARDDAKQKAQEKAEKLKQTMLDFVEGLKNGVDKALSGQQNKIDWQRDITDAKEQLRTAKLIGDPGMLRDARRALVDAQLEQKQWIASQMNVKASGPRTATVVINGMTITGVQNVQQLLAEINKAAKRNTTQTRGRLSPTTLVH